MFHTEVRGTLGFPTPQTLLTLLYILYLFSHPKWDQVFHLLVLKAVILHKTLRMALVSIIAITTLVVIQCTIAQATHTVTKDER